MVEAARAFVCGHPVKHSRSPLIHGHWLARYGLAGTYEPVAITPGGLSGFLSTMKEDGWAGGNFTIPHKEKVFSLLEHVDAAALAIGAVNTVWFESGKLHGGNTDGYGFAANLDAQTPQWRDAQNAVVFGAGGAARAVLFALIGAKIPNIIVVNRTLGRAGQLAADFGRSVKAISWENAADAAADADLLINTTSLGMDGQPEFPLDLACAKSGGVASDIVYVPLETPFLKMAARRGLKTSDGLGMLLHQAAPGFEKWFGLRPKVDAELRQLIIDDLTAGAKP